MKVLGILAHLFIYLTILFLIIALVSGNAVFAYITLATALIGLILLISLEYLDSK